MKYLVWQSYFFRLTTSNAQSKWWFRSDSKKRSMKFLGGRAKRLLQDAPQPCTCHKNGMIFGCQWSFSNVSLFATFSLSKHKPKSTTFVYLWRFIFAKLIMKTWFVCAVCVFVYAHMCLYVYVSNSNSKITRGAVTNWDEYNLYIIFNSNF